MGAPAARQRRTRFHTLSQPLRGPGTGPWTTGFPSCCQSHSTGSLGVCGEQNAGLQRSVTQSASTLLGLSLCSASGAQCRGHDPPTPLSSLPGATVRRAARSPHRGKFLLQIRHRSETTRDVGPHAARCAGLTAPSRAPTPVLAGGSPLPPCLWLGVQR